MERNPYLPPTSAVADTAGPRERMSVAVFAAILLLCVDIAFSAYETVRAVPRMRVGMVSGVEMVVRILDIVLVSAACVGLARGARWARWVLLVLTIYLALGLAWSLYATLALTPASVRVVLSPQGVLLEVVPVLLYVAATVLVFGPGRAWFARGILNPGS